VPNDAHSQSAGRRIIGITCFAQLVPLHCLAYLVLVNVVRGHEGAANEKEDNIRAPEVLVDSLFSLPAGRDLAVVPPLDEALPLETAQRVAQVVEVVLVFTRVATEYL
jgi:hypothetical protein